MNGQTNTQLYCWFFARSLCTPVSPGELQALPGVTRISKNITFI